MYENWMPYADAFKVLVHDNKDVSPIQKFYYLNSTLTHETAQLIKNLAIIDANYPVAWKLLQDRYENKRLITSAHVREIINIKLVSKEDANELRQFINTAISNFNALDVLNIQTPIHEIILSQLYIDRLDAKTKREWKLKNSTQDFPSLKDLFEFSENKCQALEALASSSSNKQKTVYERQKYKPVRHSSSYVAINSKVCECCNQPHTLYKCSKFINLSVSDKSKFVKDKKLCYNCLKLGRLVRNCSSRGCRICKGKHHTSLHISSQNNSFKSNSNNDSDSNQKSSSCSQDSPASHHSSSNTYCSLKSRAQSNSSFYSDC
ncbi:uncharacterized protein LOC142322650 [Lycorma delicatula]|uniref:uncharacterized protein LOC142322650 n=1 Tax=Lycorma delicatula TaxID=130591 RepID=UPI003F519A6A